MYLWEKLFLNLHLKERSNYVAILVTIMFGISALIPLPISTLIPILLIESAPLAGFVFYSSAKLRKKIAQYRRSEQYAIDS